MQERQHIFSPGNRKLKTHDATELVNDAVRSSAEVKVLSAF